jgi:hypothetical protein
MGLPGLFFDPNMRTVVRFALCIILMCSWSHVHCVAYWNSHFYTTRRH